jgi:XXXCH domain-containing protein
MGSREIKIEKQLSAADFENFSKDLASALLGKPEDYLSSEGINLKDYKKIRLDIKSEADLFAIKLKIKYKTPTIEEKIGDDSRGPVKYKTLKKQMKSTFKSIKSSLAAGTLPNKETVDSFMREAEMMVSYTNRGYGDEYYEEFIQFCQEFKQIFDTEDIDKLLAAYNAIDARKALCHDKYD